MTVFRSIGDFLSGKGKERIPAPAFGLMTVVMKLMDLLGRHAYKTFCALGVEPGQTVVDYGCGPARGPADYPGRPPDP